MRDFLYSPQRGMIAQTSYNTSFGNNKCEQQTSTDSLSLISNEVSSLQTELDRKPNVILSKTQTIFDKGKTTNGLVSVTCSSETNNIRGANQSQNQRTSSQGQTTIYKNNQVIGSETETVSTQPLDEISRTLQPQ